MITATLSVGSRCRSRSCRRRVRDVPESLSSKKKAKGNRSTANNKPSLTLVSFSHGTRTSASMRKTARIERADKMVFSKVVPNDRAGSHANSIGSVQMSPQDAAVNNRPLSPSMSSFTSSASSVPVSISALSALSAASFDSTVTAAEPVAPAHISTATILPRLSQLFNAGDLRGLREYITNIFSEDCTYNVKNGSLTASHVGVGKIIEFYSKVLERNPDAVWLEKGYGVVLDAGGSNTKESAVFTFLGTSTSCHADKEKFFGVTALPSVSAMMDPSLSLSAEEKDQMDQKGSNIRQQGRGAAKKGRGIVEVVVDPKSGRAISLRHEYYIVSYDERP
jgi:hypothetical protein